MSTITGNMISLNKEVLGTLKKINVADGINKKEALELKKAIMADGKVDEGEKALLDKIFSSETKIKVKSDDPGFSPLELKFGTKRIDENAKAIIQPLVSLKEQEPKNERIKDTVVGGGKAIVMAGGAKVATTVAVKTAGRLTMAVPIVGVATGVAITAYDTADAVKKSKDPNVSKTSKLLAWTTVGLDTVATGCSGVTPAATGTIMGAPVGVVSAVVGLAATGLSILTSAASEYFK